MDHFKRFFKDPEQSFFLFGPRGTGKTTWLKRHYPDAIWINLLEPEEFRYYSAYPERLRQTIDAYPEKGVIVIDEIQKIPDLLSLIHSLIEEGRNLQFIMTGSSTRKLKNQSVNLLGGRALKMHMHPFLAAELKDQFSLEKALQIGMLPLAWSAKNPVQTLRSYSGLYLNEEVRGEGSVRNIGDFSRFLEVISFSHGSLINANNIARECDVSRRTVDSYLQILEDLLLSFQVPVFTKRAKRETTAHPKFYLFDSGVFRSLRPKGPLDRPEEIDGVALEGLVAHHLHAWAEAQQQEHSLFFWRTRTGIEVDFIVYGAEVFLAVEVKNSARVFPKDVKGLRAFHEDYPECQPLLLYRGKRRTIIHNILCLPCEEFLQQIYPENSLWSKK